MKASLFFILVLGLAACGKKDHKSGSTSISALQSNGISIQSYGQAVVVSCQTVNNITNQRRIEMLTSYRNSIRPTNNYMGVQLGNSFVDPNRLRYVIDQAIYVLRQSSGTNQMYNNQYNQYNQYNQGGYMMPQYQCPASVLAQG